jgi:hypothetical protein
MKPRVLLAVALLISLPFLACGGQKTQGADADQPENSPEPTPATSDAPIVIDAGVAGPPIQRGLLGWHDWQPDSGNITTAEILADGKNIQVSFWRVVADDLPYDCTTQSFDPTVLQDYMDWMDAIQSIGAEPVMSLSYVPPCMGYEGQSHTYPVDAAAYAKFLDLFLSTFVSGRIADGKQPLHYIESWNEPDSPLGVNFVGGTLDDFVNRVFVPLGLAIQKEKARSGVDIQFGGTASVNGFAFGDIDPDPARILELLRPDLPQWLCEMAAYLANWFLTITGEGGLTSILEAGGFRWTDPMVKAADAAGFDLDYVSWHNYLNNPLPGDIPSEPLPDKNALDDLIDSFFCGHNPLANIAQFEADALRWRERYPGKKLLLTEWGIASGADDRIGTYDDAAFHAAALIAMQTGGMDGAMALSARNSSETVWYPHWFFYRMADQTVQVTMKDSPEKTGIWALASFDKSAARLTILVAQWLTFSEDATILPIDVDVLGLPPGRYNADVYQIDRDNAGSTQPNAVYEVDVSTTGPASLQIPLYGDAVAFVELQMVPGGPS